jgi:hypothetical protein
VLNANPNWLKKNGRPLLRQSLYLLAVLNRPPQDVAGMTQPFGHLLLVSRWMPQHFGRKEKALHIVK